MSATQPEPIHLPAPEPIAVDLAIVVLPGFQQWAGPGTGCWKLYNRLCRTYRDRTRSLVLLRAWDSDPKLTAALIDERHAATTIAIGYSYGAGWGVTQLADELDQLQRRIDVAFLIDPVPRYRFLPAKLLSLTRQGTYEVPANVTQAYSWRQVNKRSWDDPVGRPIRAADPSQTWTQELAVYGADMDLLHQHGGSNRNWRLDADIHHSNIDDRPEIHDAILTSIARAVAPVRRTP
ncbi:MAG: hypothetical protein ACLFV3_09200 [Phycisphaeraceae bacterium]